LGQIYLEQNLPEQAYARFQDSVLNYPTFFDTYSGLVVLVQADQPVNDLMRGIIDYYAGQYGVATEALDRYMKANPQHDGTSHYYKALSLYNMGDYEGEISEWDMLIKDHSADQFLPQAYLEKATTQWEMLTDYLGSAQTLLQFVSRVPDSPKAAEYLYRAANIYEIGGYLTRAAKTWQRVFDEFPGSGYAYESLFKSGIAYYRLEKYEEAQVTFQKLLVLSTDPEDLARTNFWVAKSMEKRGEQEKAQEYYQQSSIADPTGYYSIRAGEILATREPFSPQSNNDLAVDFASEREKAEKWMRTKFNLEDQVDLSSLAELSGNPLFQRGETYWELGLRDEARSEFEKLRQELQSDAVNTYRLMNHMLELGFYQTAALSSRQVLDAAGLTQDQTLTDAPVYFNHIRFGVFYHDLIISAARENGIDPLLLFSIIRQESLFDASISSSAGARGLMQITAETGEYIAVNYGWPPDYQFSDLDRPMINVRMGARYFKYWLDKYGGNVSAALASYNAGDGNNQSWMEIAGDDSDLLLEVIRFDETSSYIRYIRENYAIYQTIYTHP
jgi:soluble lytic murein transglycosylase